MAQARTELVEGVPKPFLFAKRATQCMFYEQERFRAVAATDGLGKTPCVEVVITKAPLP